MVESLAKLGTVFIKFRILPPLPFPAAAFIAAFIVDVV